MYLTTYLYIGEWSLTPESLNPTSWQAIRTKRRKESTMLKQVIATGEVAPQNTLKRTREAVSRWLVTNEDTQGTRLRVFQTL